MRVREFIIGVKLALVSASAAGAHVAEQGFVLLLPTGAYTAAGVAVVALTALALFALPERGLNRAFAAHTWSLPSLDGARAATSLISLAALIGLIWLGLYGPRDPLSNLMPLGFWTLGWVLFVSLCGFLGNLWHWVNPWFGLYAILGRPQLWEMPKCLGVWPASLLMVAFAGFLLADVAPDDPARLATVVALYWCAILTGACFFGISWFEQVELGQVTCRAYGLLAPVSSRGGGAPGWQVLVRAHPVGFGAFALILLAAGSFDGLNETFWWLGLIGVNPLEFPGRSAVVGVTLAGLLVSVLGLLAVFALTLWLGLKLAHAKPPLGQVFALMGLSLLPIAFVYHIAHYLTSFLVSIQYTLAALSDPLARGWDLLGLGDFRVTTGFFNRLDTVRLIWLTQAGLVVLGHVWSVLLAHRIALDLVPEPRRAGLLTLPLSLFMIAYTCLGLWLLAAPKGA